MTRAEHIKRHIDLDRSLYELVAEFAIHTGVPDPTSCTIAQLLSWSAKETKNPTEGGINL